MNTASPGSPDEPGERGFPIVVALIAGALVLLLTLLIGPRVLGILTGIVAPPEPPLPSQADLVNYELPVHGVDRWQYTTGENLCQLIAFYRPLATQCPVLPLDCGGTAQDSDFMAACYGDVEFSIFAMRWQLRVPLRSVGGPPLHFEVWRDVYWNGHLPPEPFD